MSISAPILSEVLDRIDHLGQSLSQGSMTRARVSSSTSDTHGLVSDLREWVTTVSVAESDAPYLSTFRDSLWWADTTLARVDGERSEPQYGVRLLCGVLDELRSAVVLLRRDLADY